MPKFRANFSETGAIAVFSEGGRNYQDFADLLIDRYHGTLNGISEKEADEKIRAIFMEVCGMDANAEYKRSDYKKAVRRSQLALFEVVEEVTKLLKIA